MAHGVFLFNLAELVIPGIRLRDGGAMRVNISGNTERTFRAVSRASLARNTQEDFRLDIRGGSVEFAAISCPPLEDEDRVKG